MNRPPQQQQPLPECINLVVSNYTRRSFWFFDRQAIQPAESFPQASFLYNHQQQIASIRRLKISELVCNAEQQQLFKQVLSTASNLEVLEIEGLQFIGSKKMRPTAGKTSSARKASSSASIKFSNGNLRALVILVFNPLPVEQIDFDFPKLQQLLIGSSSVQPRLDDSRANSKLPSTVFAKINFTNCSLRELHLRQVNLPSDLVTSNRLGGRLGVTLEHLEFDVTTANLTKLKKLIGELAKLNKICLHGTPDIPLLDDLIAAGADRVKVYHESIRQEISSATSSATSRSTCPLARQLAAFERTDEEIDLLPDEHVVDMMPNTIDFRHLVKLVKKTVQEAS